MGKKLNVPSVAGNIEGIPFGATMFLQAVQDALNTLDNNVVYKDAVSVNIGPPKLRAIGAQGQAFTVEGTNLASGDDYAVLVSNVKTMLEELNALRTQVSTLISQLQGS